MEAGDDDRPHQGVVEKAMRIATLFSGIGAPEVAAKSLGWECLWSTEIEPFPSAVLAARHPETVNLGDVTTPDFCERALSHGKPDVLVFGSPCQSFSVAGKRLGMDDPRGNLALIALGICRDLCPEWIVFENVPGLLSSASGRDFGAFLGALGECGYGWAYRVLDAQFYGVPQRRRRVFVVGHLGDWRRAAAVLLERESLSGNPPPSREKGERVAGTVKGGSGERGYPDPSDGNGGGLIAHSLYAGNAEGGARDLPFLTSQGIGGTAGISNQTPLVLAHEQGNAEIVSDGNPSLTCNHEAPIAFYLTNRQPEFGNYSDVCPSIKVGSGGQSGNPPAVAFSCKDSGNDAGEVSPPLRAMGHDGSHANAGGQVAVAIQLNGDRDAPGISISEDTAFTLPANPMSDRGQAGAMINMQGSKGNAIAQEDGPSFTLNAMHGHDVHAVAIRTAQTGANGIGVAEEVAHTLDQAQGQAVAFTQNQVGDVLHGDVFAAMGTNQNATGRNTPKVQQAMSVRRLTPRECERFQGFPDDFTAIAYKGKPAADGPRYKALGNSMAVPVVEWILSRIQKVQEGPTCSIG